MWVGRPKPSRPLVRFEGLPGEFSQHDFGEVDVRFVNGTQRRTHFFASRLKSSRGSEVTLVLDQRVESLVRALVDHFAAIGGVPLLAVFDRPRTVAIAWRRDGVVTEWNPTFAGVALDLGLGIEVCWPYRPQQKGSVENLVGWVKGSFFKQRRFIDDEDLAHAIVDRILARGRLLHLNGSSMRTRHLGLDETTIEALSPQMGGISGIQRAEFPEPTPPQGGFFYAFRCLGRHLQSKRRSKPMAGKPAPTHDCEP